MRSRVHSELMMVLELSKARAGLPGLDPWISYEMIPLTRNTRLNASLASKCELKEVKLASSSAVLFLCCLCVHPFGCAYI